MKILKEIEELKKQIENLANQVRSPNEDIKEDSTTPEQKQEPTKVVILKCKNYQKLTADKDTCRQIINSKLPESKLADDAIAAVEDYRMKNGPIILTFKDEETKVSTMKKIKVDKTFIIRNCLSKNTLQIRKKANLLVQKGILFKWWIRRGDVYYTLFEGGRPMLANSLAELDRQERACLFTRRGVY